MTRSIFSILSLLYLPLLTGQTSDVVYFFPGQGGDARLFQDIELDLDTEIRYIKYHVPEEGITMKEYAEKLIDQIDPSESYSFVGASLGGMFIVELTDILKPEKSIIISSAKCAKELPKRYTFQKKVPIYKMLPADGYDVGARIMQPLVEPDRNKKKDTFVAMLKSKQKKFLKRTTHLILNWDREEYNEDIIHIHGNKDKTIPIRNVDYDFLIQNGSHMISLTRSEEISILLNQILGGNILSIN